MRNKYKGICYKCNKLVKPGEGYFERYKGRWRTQHVLCVGKVENYNKINEKELTT